MRIFFALLLSSLAPAVITMHIGLIGGIGPAAAAFYYQRIVQLFNEAGAPLSLTMVHTDISNLMKNMEAGAPEAQADEYLRVTKQLAAAGADIAVVTSFGGSFCADEFEKISPLPTLNGPAAMADYLKEEGLACVGLLGTTTVMGSRLYGKLDGVCETLIPGDDGDEAMEQAHSDYIAIASNGAATAEQRDRLFAAAQRLCDRGAQAVILGGTDLNVIFDGSQTMPVVDSAEVHVQAIVKRALASPS